MPTFCSTSRSTRLLRAVALAFGLICLAYLLAGPKPWIEGASAAEAAGEKLRVSHYRVTGMWFGALGNLLLAAGVFALARWFSGGGPGRGAAPLNPELQRGTQCRRAILGATAAAMLIAATGAVPRLDHGLWDDEDRCVRHFVLGQHLRSKSSGEFSFRPVSWEETAFDFSFPNHTFYTLCAKLAHAAWPPRQGPGLDYINESAIRLPSVIGGLLGLGAVALLLAELGFRRAAIIAPLLLAVHPWYLRYSSEARGYGLVFLLAPLALWLLARALRLGAWRWWLGFALVQFLLVYTVLSTLYLLLFTNLAAALWIWHAGEARRRLFRRWMLANTATFALGLGLMLPHAPQLMEYLDGSGSARVEKKVELLAKDSLSAFATGVRYQGFEEHHAPSLKQLLEERNPVGTGLLLLAVASAAVAGALRLARAGPNGWALLAVVLLTGPAFYAISLPSGALVFFWYMVILLPLFWVLVAIGASGLASRIESRWWPRQGALVCALVGMAFAALLFWVSYPQRAFLVSRPIEATLESVARTRSVVDPLDPDYDQVLVIGFDRRFAYDGARHRAADAEELQQWIIKADTEAKPLYVNYSATSGTRRSSPGILAVVENPEFFEVVEFFPGVDPGTDRVVRKYITGSFPGRRNPDEDKIRFVAPPPRAYGY